MRASFSVEDFALPSLRLLRLVLVIALTLLLLPMNDASAQQVQRELVALNNRVKQLWVGGRRTRRSGSPRNRWSCRNRGLGPTTR